MQLEKHVAATTNASVIDLEVANELARCHHSVGWTDPQLARIEKLRLNENLEVLYCLGRLRDGTLVQVLVPFSKFEQGKESVKEQIVRYARRAGVYAKPLGIFSAVSIYEP